MYQEDHRTSTTLMTDTHYTRYDDSQNYYFLEKNTTNSYRHNNLDNFLRKSYNYYAGKGFYPILVAKGLNLL